MSASQHSEHDASPSARYIVGHVVTVLRSLPDASVDLVLTSPAFLGLRNYLPKDDPMKRFEMGSEATPGEFLDALLDVVEECRRVLTPHGTIAIELGDTYAGSGGSGGDYGADGLRAGQQKFSGSAAKRRKLGLGENDRPARPRRTQFEDPRYKGRSTQGSGAGGEDWPLDKSLCLVPELLRFALAYGFNPLTGRSTPRWRVRNVVRWCRPNPTVGKLADKFRPATSDMVIACVSRRRYFDLDAVRTPSSYDRPNLKGKGARSDDVPGQRKNTSDHTVNVGGAPPLDWWEIPTVPYPGSHFAVWPPTLLERPIEAMCPRKVCTVCGKPSERQTERTGDLDVERPQAVRAMELAKEAGLTTEHLAAVRAFGIQDAGKATTTQTGAGKNSERVKALAAEAKEALGGYFREFLTEVPTTTGWTDCGHDAWRAGVVLDPFAGSGTTLAVAFGHGRSSIGVDLDIRNTHLATERVGMWLQTEDARHLELVPAVAHSQEADRG